MQLSHQELEQLSLKFSDNVLDATKKYEKLISDPAEIEGLPPSALGLAAQTAVSKVRVRKGASCRCPACSALPVPKRCAGRGFLVLMTFAHGL